MLQYEWMFEQPEQKDVFFAILLIIIIVINTKQIKTQQQKQIRNLTIIEERHQI